MRHGLSRPPARRKPWHARTETRLGAAVLAMLLLAGGAAAVRSDGGEPASPAVALAPQQAAVPATAVEVPLAVVRATAVPTPPPTPAPMRVDLRPTRVGQGETMLVWAHAPGAASVTLEFRGGVYRLLSEAEVFWGVVGLPLDAPLGPGELTLTARSGAGELLERAVGAYEVAAVDRPVDALVLTTEQASVLTPEAAARERETARADLRGVRPRPPLDHVLSAAGGGAGHDRLRPGTLVQRRPGRQLSTPAPTSPRPKAPG